MIIEKLKKPQFGIYNYYAHGTVKCAELPLDLYAVGYGNTPTEAVVEALQLAADVKAA